MILHHAICGLLLVVGAAAFAQHPSPPTPEARAAWGFDRSDLLPDPRIRFGVAASGLRYAILANRVPRGAVALRVRVAAGAAMGAPGEAHYVEHLSFHGSARFPEGAAAWLRRREGLALGRDFNAATGYSDTVYRIDLPRAGRARLDRILYLVCDMIFGPGLGRHAVERARPALIAEARQRDGPEDRMERDRAAFLAPGSPFARAPGGTEEDLRAITAGALNRFRSLHYSPDRVTLIVVGDVDPSAVEARIRACFDGLPSYDGPPDPPPALIATDRPTAFRLFRAPGTPTWASVAAILPRGGADNVAPRDRGFLASLAADMLAARVTGYRGEDRPFMDAEALVQDHYGLARIASFRVRAIDRDWRLALEVAERELRRALLHGFRQAELDVALARERERLGALAGPQASAALADRIAAMVGGGIVPTAPGGPADSAAYLARIRLDAVNAALRASWAAPGQLVHVSHDREIEGGEARIAEAWAASARRPVAAQ